MKTGYYTANSINGVTFYDTFMDLDVDILSPVDFYEELETSDETPIYTFIDAGDAEIFEKIQREYGITDLVS